MDKIVKMGDRGFTSVTIRTLAFGSFPPVSHADLLEAKSWEPPTSTV